MRVVGVGVDDAGDAIALVQKLQPVDDRIAAVAGLFDVGRRIEDDVRADGPPSRP